MGYYLKALQTLCYALNVEQNPRKAKRLLEETSMPVLENEILFQKETIDFGRFMYTAGGVKEYVLHLADEAGIEAWNTCVGSVKFYEDFIFGNYKEPCIEPDED